VPKPSPSPDPSNPLRLPDAQVAGRINLLFLVFPNPLTGRPYTSAEAAAAVSAAGTPVSERLIERLRAQPDPSNLPRLKGDDLATRIERLCAASPNPSTGRPYTSAELAAAISAAGTTTSKRTIENARAKNSQHRPSANTLEGIANVFQVDVGYLFPDSVSDTRIREQQEAEAASSQPSDAELAAILKLFQEPDRLGLWFLQEGERGDQLDAELQVFAALRDSDVRAVAMRFKKADPSTKRSIARQLGMGTASITRRRTPGQDQGDGR
jgi:transcriptional regulator with XRE-family HTH domain